MGLARLELGRLGWSALDMPGGNDRFARTAFVLTFSLLSGCVAGPAWKVLVAPAGAARKSYTPPGKADQDKWTGADEAADQTLEVGNDAPARWWSLFESESLDQLIDTALTKNPTLAAARASLQQAEENFHAQVGSTRYPSIEARLSASRARAVVPGSAIIGTGNEFSTSAQASYAFDVAGGGIRRTDEALAATIDNRCRPLAVC